MSFEEWFEGIQKEGGFIEEREWAEAGWEAGYRRALVEIWEKQEQQRNHQGGHTSGYAGGQDDAQEQWKKGHGG